MVRFAGVVLFQQKGHDVGQDGVHEPPDEVAPEHPQHHGEQAEGGVPSVPACTGAAAPRRPRPPGLSVCTHPLPSRSAADGAARRGPLHARCNRRRGDGAGHRWVRPESRIAAPHERMPYARPVTPPVKNCGA